MAEGRLFLVVGPSGAGKDTLLGLARERLGDGPEAPVFLRRHITRPAEAGGEDHHPLTPDQFREALAEGRFALHWQANGHAYGIGRELDALMAAGRSVVINGSRAVLPAAAARWPGLRVILVTASPEIRAARLQERGREDAAEILARLARQPPIAAPGLVTVLNEATPEAGAKALLGALA